MFPGWKRRPSACCGRQLRHEESLGFDFLSVIWSGWMCVFCIVALICSSEAAFARRRVIDPRAQSRRGEAKKCFPPVPLVLLWSWSSGCIGGGSGCRGLPEFLLKRKQSSAKSPHLPFRGCAAAAADWRNGIVKTKKRASDKIPDARYIHTSSHPGPTRAQHQRNRKPRSRNGFRKG